MPDVSYLLRKLKANNKTEGLAVLSYLDQNEWTIVKEPEGCFWKSPGGELYGPLGDEDDIIDMARSLYRTTYQTGAPDAQNVNHPTEEHNEDPSTAHERHRREADEIDLRDNLIKFLESEGVKYWRNVGCRAGAVEVVAEDAVYAFKCSLTSASLAEPANELVSCWRELTVSDKVELSDDASAIIIVCCAENLVDLKYDAVENYAVEVKTLEEITTPSPLAEPAGEESAINESAPTGDSLFPSPQVSSAALVQQMRPSLISRHPSLLMRAGGLDEEHVSQLEEAYRQGRTLPPLDIFYDGETYLVAEGNHRHEAATRAGTHVDVTVYAGGLREAILFALQANAEHGLRLSRDDKRLKAVTLLADKDWFKESDSVLSTYAGGITQQFISSVRRDLVKLTHAMIEDPEGEESDEHYSTTLDIPVGLVSIVRGLPAEEREQLTQNILSDDGKRRGADGVVRSPKTVSTETEEPEATLFSTPDDVAADEVAIQPGISTPSQNIVGDSGTAVAYPEAGDQVVESTTESEHREQFDPSFRLATLLKSHPSGLDAEEILAAGFTMHQINLARTSRVIDRNENGRCFYAWKPADVVSALGEHGTLSRLELENLGCQSYVISGALSEGLISQPETGKFALPDADRPAKPAQTIEAVPPEVVPLTPATPARAQGAQEPSKPSHQPAPREDAGEVFRSIEKRLKGKTMVCGITFIAGLKGKVQATVNLGNNAQGAARELFGIEELVLPPRMLRMIDSQIGDGKKSTSAAAATSPTTEKRSEEPPPKVERIQAAIRSAKTAPELEKQIKHYKLDNLSRFSSKDADLIRAALTSQKKRLGGSGAKKRTSTKTPPARASKGAGKTSASKGAKKGASKKSRARV